MKLRNLLIATLLVAASAATGAAQVSPARAEWAKGPVQFLMTKEEAATWKTLPSDDAALAFIDLFWARRDPTPTTPRNEFREEFEAKVKYADQTFRGGRARGSVSDRGKILVLFGPPSKATQTGGGKQQSAFEDETTTNRVAGQPQEPSRVTWLYEGEAAQKPFGLPRAEFTFVDQFNSGDYRLTNARIDVNAAQQKAIAASITQPTLTAAPKFQQPAPAAAAQQAPAAAPAPAAAANALKTPSLEAAVADAKAGKGAKSVQVATVEFVSPTGEAYIPLLLYVPSAAGLTADSADTFFGVVEDASGNRVTAFEEPVKLTATKTDFFADRTLALPAGKYTAYVGLAKGGQPVVATSAPIEVPATAKDAPGVSKLVLSDNIYELAIAEPVKAPFAFGKLKIVPKGNLTFANNADLSYFVEVNNPGIDTASNLPKLQYKLDLVGGPEKKTISAPLSDVQALPLSGAPGPGHYAIVSSIPLGELKPALKPGDYTLRMKIVDTVTKQSYTVEQAFNITLGSQLARTEERPARPTESSGTGFLVARDLLATNWHVVSDARKVEVFFADAPKPYSARVVRRDPNNDLALLKIDDFDPERVGCSAAPFPVRPAADVRLGARVFAIGFPLEGILGNGAKYAEGVVSSKTGIHDDPRVYQVTVPIQPGNSGSPLFSDDGALLGVVVSSLNAAYLYGRTEALPQNVNFAIKADYLAALLEQHSTSHTAGKSASATPESLSRCVALIRATN